MKFHFLFVLVYLLLIAGCGQSNDPSSVAPSTTASQVATVRINQVLLRAVPKEVTSQRFTGFDDAGLARYGPETRDKAPVIELNNVSTAVVRLQIEYLQGETVVGLGSLALELTPGETVEINNPPFQDVVSALSSLQVTPDGTTIPNGSAQQFMVVGTFADNTQLDLTTSATWSSSNPAVSTIAPGGLASTVGPGETTVTAAVGPVRDSTTLTVSEATTSSIQITPDSPVIAVGATQPFTATATLSDGTTQDVTGSAVWSSDNTGIATIVEDSGLATATGLGSARIIATFGGQTGSTDIVVTEAVLVSLTVNPPQALSAPGTRRRFRALGTYSDGTTRDLTSQVTWSSDNTDVTMANDNLGPNQIGQASIRLGAPYTGLGAPVTVTAALGSDSASSTLYLGSFAFVANRDSDNVSVYSLDPDTGGLTEVGTPIEGGDGPISVVVEPSGRFAYLANSLSNNVSVYSIDPTNGALTPTPFLPVPAGTEPSFITTDPLGRFVYVPNRDSDTVSVYAAEPTTGELTPVPPAASTGLEPRSIDVDPTGRFAYVTNGDSDNVSVYSIDPVTGGLTEVGTPVTTSESPLSVTIDPTGRFAYVANNGLSSNVSIFAINQITGALTPAVTPEVPAGNGPRSIAVDPTGRFAYVACQRGDTISVFTIDPGSGVLTPAVNTDVLAGDGPTSVTVDPTGRFVYVANFISDNVSVFSINSTTGELTPAVPRDVDTGEAAFSVVTTP